MKKNRKAKINKKNIMSKMNKIESKIKKRGQEEVENEEEKVEHKKIPKQQLNAMH